MSITPSKLRQNIYRLLDQVIQTGIPLEIKRKGIKLKIIPTKKKSKLDNLKKMKKNRKYLNCKPDELVHIDWSKQWKPYI